MKRLIAIVVWANVALLLAVLVVSVLLNAKKELAGVTDAMLLLSSKTKLLNPVSVALIDSGADFGVYSPFTGEGVIDALARDNNAELLSYILNEFDLTSKAVRTPFTRMNGWDTPITIAMARGNNEFIEVLTDHLLLLPREPGLIEDLQAVLIQSCNLQVLREFARQSVFYDTRFYWLARSECPNRFEMLELLKLDKAIALGFPMHSDPTPMILSLNDAIYRLISGAGSGFDFRARMFTRHELATMYGDDALMQWLEKQKP